jgi:hypothetical protein
MMTVVAFLCGGPTRGGYALLTRLSRYVISALLAALCARAATRLSLRLLRAVSPLLPKNRLTSSLSISSAPFGYSSSSSPSPPLAYYSNLKRLLAHTALPACVIDLQAYAIRRRCRVIVACVSSRALPCVSVLLSESVSVL